MQPFSIFAGIVASNVRTQNQESLRLNLCFYDDLGSKSLKQKKDECLTFMLYGEQYQQSIRLALRSNL